MAESVFDTRFVAAANGNSKGRVPGNVMDRRLQCIERAVCAPKGVRVNSKLKKEYADHLSVIRNNSIAIFVEIINDKDKHVFIGRNTLSGSHGSEARDARWPKHDDHLLAAAVSGKRVTVYTTELAHKKCQIEIRRRLGVGVSCISS